MENELLLWNWKQLLVCAPYILKTLNFVEEITHNEMPYELLIGMA
jgi:hypothetical protein